MAKTEKYTEGKWTYSPMKGKRGHCFCAQVWDVKGNSIATIDSRYGAKKATEIARLMASSQELAEILEKIIREVKQTKAFDTSWDLTDAIEEGLTVIRKVKASTK